MEVPWHALSGDAAVAKLASSLEGLAPTQVLERQERFGSNELTAAPPQSTLGRFFSQFRDITVLALIAAAALACGLALMSAAEQTPLERYGDVLAIAAIVLLNAIMGTVQEGKADAALRSLAQVHTPLAQVRRDGARASIDAKYLVPGDIVFLVEGDRVPADLRLLQCDELRIDESSLTGESVAILKSSDVLPADLSLAARRNCCFAGTYVRQGTAQGVVTGTGMSTELGKIASLLGQAEVRKTPLQHQLNRFGSNVVWGCVGLAIFVFVVSAVRTTASVSDSLLVAVSLAVAAIPEGLPAITTVVLALGVRRMATNHAIVRRLSAVETLGSVHVICTDKTGTLTENHMRVRHAWVPQGAADPTPASQNPALIEASYFAAGVDQPLKDRLAGDPTDVALAEFSRRSGLRVEAVVTRQQPFNSTLKLASVSVRKGLQRFLLVRGAPESVLSRCDTVLLGEQATPLTTEQRDAATEVIEQWASSALRVIAVARKELPNEPAGTTSSSSKLDQAAENLCFIGLLGLIDPPRPEVREAIQLAKRAGIRTLMITGDHPTTAMAIAEELMLRQPEAPLVLPGTEVSALSDEQLDACILQVGVVARATAEDKMRVVRSLQRQRRVVAMTGDGVNDAPALKAADIGVAMGLGGTDVSREASALILTDDHYATIVSAIELGRLIYRNIQRFIIFLFAANSGLVLLVCGASILGLPPALLPTQILWVNLITNGLPALALGMEPRADDVMSQPPRASNAPLLRRQDLSVILLPGAWMAAMGALAFGWVYDGDLGQLRRAQTLTFCVLSWSPLFHAFSARSDGSVFKVGLFSNRTLLWAVALGFALQAMAIGVPAMQQVFRTTALSATDLAVGLLLAASILPLVELVKRTWPNVFRDGASPGDRS